MALLVNKKRVGAPFDGKVELLRVEYDFANDAGAIADFEVLEADSKCLVRLRSLNVETQVTSGGSLVLDLGKGAGGVEFLSDAAVATLTADAVILSDTAETTVLLADGDTIQMGIEAATATAGKFSMVFEVYSF